LRQERPPHLRPDGIHPAMRERGRAIPATTTVPIVAEEKQVPSTAPRIVEGRVSNLFILLNMNKWLNISFISSLDLYRE